MSTDTAVSLRDFIGVGDADEIAVAFLDALDADELRRELLPYVRYRAMVMLRRDVRVAEHEVFGTGTGSATGAAIRANLMERRALLIGKTFALRDGTRVAWTDATPEQHRERAAIQRELAGHCIVDAKRHEEAAKVIEEFGVSCLAEVPE